MIDALVFPLPLLRFVSSSLFALLLISGGKAGGRRRKGRFLQPCLAARWKNRLHRTKGLFLEPAWHRDALLLTALVFIAFVNRFILVCPLLFHSEDTVTVCNKILGCE